MVKELLEMLVLVGGLAFMVAVSVGICWLKATKEERR